MLSWPASTRDRDGEDLLKAFGQNFREPGSPLGRLAVLVGECLSVLREGIGFRCTALAEGLRSSVTGGLGDYRHAWRSLRRNPGFALMVATTLGVGIGANAAVFTVARQSLLTPPPYASPDRLIFVWQTLGSSSSHLAIAAPDVAEVARRTRVMASIGFVGQSIDGSIVVGTAPAEPVRIATVTENLFDVLGVEPVLGAGFTTNGADGADVAQEVMLSHHLWMRAFGSRRDIVGTTVRIDGRAFSVAGVLPAHFRLDLPSSVGMGRAADAWTRLPRELAAFQRPPGRRLDQDSDNTGAAIARLAVGVDPDQAAQAVARVSAELRAELPEYGAAEIGLVVSPLPAEITAHLRGLFAVLLGGVVLVLIVTCLNVSTAMLARNATRVTELEVRRALGAGMPRIVRYLIAEIGILVGSGIAVAILLGTLVRNIMVTMVPGLSARVGPEGLEPTMLLAVTGATLIITFASGLAPALRAPSSKLHSRAGRDILRGPKRRNRAREALLVGQIAVVVVLVLGGGLFVRSTQALLAIDPGFDPEGALSFQLGVRASDRYRSPSERARVVQEITNALRSLPGVQAVGITGHLPLSGRRWTQPFGLPGQPETEWSGNRADFRSVTSGYFRAMGTDVLEGRGFSSDEDLYEERRVVIVDEVLAQRIAPSGSAVGAEIGFPLDGAMTRAEIVGVVEAVRNESLTAPSRFALYVPYRQEASRDVSFVIRTDTDPTALAPSVRNAVRVVDDELALYGLRSLSEYVDDSMAPAHLAVRAMVGFAFLTLLAAAIGLYGVVAMDVSTRKREIGVRIAIGAGRAAVVRSVLWTGLKLSALGAAVGGALAGVLYPIVSPMAFGASPLDPVLWAIALSFVAVTTIVACWIPARRASRLDPNQAMRSE